MLRHAEPVKLRPRVVRRFYGHDVVVVVLVAELDLDCCAGTESHFRHTFEGTTLAARLPIGDLDVVRTCVDIKILPARSC